jgi:hypothetical protein
MTWEPKEAFAVVANHFGSNPPAKEVPEVR